MTASWTIESQEGRLGQYLTCCRMGLADLRGLVGGGAPVPGGRPNAEPGGGRASGAAQRRRLDLRTARFGNASDVELRRAGLSGAIQLVSCSSASAYELWRRLRPRLPTSRRVAPRCHAVRHYLDGFTGGCHTRRMDQAAAIVAASVISAVVALAVVTIQWRAEQRRLSRTERIKRLAAFVAESHAVIVAIGDLARAAAQEKTVVEERIRHRHADRINFRLAQIRLLEDIAIVEAAVALDRQLVVEADEARSRIWSRDEWRERRKGVIGCVEEFERVARAALRPGAPWPSDSSYIFLRGN